MNEGNYRNAIGNWWESICLTFFSNFLTKNSGDHQAKRRKEGKT
jgi:hypothetical protein